MEAAGTESVVVTEGSEKQAAIAALEGQEVASTEEKAEVEAPKEEAKKPEDDAFSRKFAALSKKERQIRQREQQLNAKMADLEARLKSLEPKEEVKAPSIPIEKRLKQNPLETLRELGLSYEKLTELALNDGKMSMEDKVEMIKEELEAKHMSEIEKLREELREKEKKTEQEKYDEVIQNFMVDLTSFVNSNEDDYELIRANDAVSVVYNVIEQHHAKTGRILSNKEAADHVEAHLLEEAQKLLKLKKLGFKKEPEVAKKPVTQPISPTLSNSVATTLSDKTEKIMNDSELKAAAAAMLKWE